MSEGISLEKSKDFSQLNDVQNEVFVFPNLVAPFNDPIEWNYWKRVSTEEQIKEDHKTLETKYNAIINLQEMKMLCFDKLENILKEIGDHFIASEANVSQEEKNNSINAEKGKLADVRELLKRERSRFRKFLRDCKSHMRKFLSIKTEADLLLFKEKLANCLEAVLIDLQNIEKAFEIMRKLISNVINYNEIICVIEKYEKIEIEISRLMVDVALEYYKFNQCAPISLRLFQQLLNSILNDISKIGKKYKAKIERINDMLDTMENCLSLCFVHRMTNKKGKEFVIEMWREWGDHNIANTSHYLSYDIGMEGIKKIIQHFKDTLREMTIPINDVKNNIYEWICMRPEFVKDLKKFPQKIEQLENKLKAIANQLADEKEEQKKKEQELKNNKEEQNEKRKSESEDIDESESKWEGKGEGEEEEERKEKGDKGTEKEKKNKQVRIIENEKEMRRKRKLIDEMKSGPFEKNLEQLIAMGNELQNMLLFVLDVERAKEYDEKSIHLLNVLENEIPNINKRNTFLTVLLSSVRYNMVAVPRIIKSYMYAVDYDKAERDYLEKMLNISNEKIETFQALLTTAQGLHSVAMSPQTSDDDARGFAKTLLLYVIEITVSIEEICSDAKYANEHIQKWETQKHIPIEVGCFIARVSIYIQKGKNILGSYKIIQKQIFHELHELKTKELDLLVYIEGLMQKMSTVEEALQMATKRLATIDRNTNKKQLQLCKEEILGYLETVFKKSEDVLPNINKINELIGKSDDNKWIKRNILHLQKHAFELVKSSKIHFKQLSETVKTSIIGIHDVEYNPAYMNKLEKCYDFLSVYLDEVLYGVNSLVKRANRLLEKWEKMLTAKIKEMKGQQKSEVTQIQLHNFQKEVTSFILKAETYFENIQTMSNSLDERSKEFFLEIFKLKPEVSSNVYIPSIKKQKEDIKMKLTTIKENLLKAKKLNEEQTQTEKQVQSQMQLQKQKQQIKSVKQGMIQMVQVINELGYMKDEMKTVEHLLEYNARVASIFLELKTNNICAKDKLVYFKKVLEMIHVKTLEGECKIKEISLNLFLYDKKKKFLSEKFLIQEELSYLKKDTTEEIKMIEVGKKPQSHLQSYFYHIAFSIVMKTMHRHNLAQRIETLKKNVNNIINEQSMVAEAISAAYIIKQITCIEKQMLTYFSDMYKGLQQIIQPLKKINPLVGEHIKSASKIKVEIETKMEQIEKNLKLAMKEKTLECLRNRLKNLKKDLENIVKANEQLVPDFRVMKNHLKSSKQGKFCLRVIERYRINVEALKPILNKNIQDLINTFNYSTQMYELINNEMFLLGDKKLYAEESRKIVDYNDIQTISRMYKQFLTPICVIQNELKQGIKSPVRNSLEDELLRKKQIQTTETLLKRLEKDMKDARYIYEYAKMAFLDSLKYRLELVNACKNLNEKIENVFQQTKRIRTNLMNLKRYSESREQWSRYEIEACIQQNEMVQCIVLTIDVAKEIITSIQLIKIHLEYYLKAKRILWELESHKLSFKQKLTYIQAQLNILKNCMQTRLQEIQNIEVETEARFELPDVVKAELKHVKLKISHLSKVVDIAEFTKKESDETHDSVQNELALKKFVIYVIHISEGLKHLLIYFKDIFRPLLQSLEHGEEETIKKTIESIKEMINIKQRNKYNFAQRYIEKGKQFITANLPAN